jgi:hypothetical protein
MSNFEPPWGKVVCSDGVNSPVKKCSFVESKMSALKWSPLRLGAKDEGIRYNKPLRVYSRAQSMLKW